jgi:hypothetical protein
VPAGPSHGPESLHPGSHSIKERISIPRTINISSYRLERGGYLTAKIPELGRPFDRPGFLLAIESVSLTANSAANSTTKPCANGATGATAKFVANE